MGLRLELKGEKSDVGKLRWELLPWDAIALVVQVLTLGALKYSARNWELGIAHSRTFAAAQRHTIAWFQEGVEYDVDLHDRFGVKVHPLACAICELLFALAFSVRGRVEVDDRPCLPPTQSSN